MKKFNAAQGKKNYRMSNSLHPSPQKKRVFILNFNFSGSWAKAMLGGSSK